MSAIFFVSVTRNDKLKRRTFTCSMARFSETTGDCAPEGVDLHSEAKTALAVLSFRDG